MMSVDDILNDPKLSMKRRRKVRDANTVNGNNSSDNRGGVPNGGRGGTVSSALTRQTTTSATISSSTTKLNAGQGDRKKRLERLQREQLVQRRLLGQQQQQQQNSEVGRKLFQQQHTLKEKIESAHSISETNQGDLSATTTTTTTKRRSPRVSTTTVTTYIVAELSKNGISNEFSTTTTAAATGPSEQSSQGETNTQKETRGDDDSGDLNDTIAQNSPTTVESALSSLLSNYKSCISTTTNSPPHETETTETNANTASTAVSPWSVIQVLPQLLQFVNLKQPTTSTTPATTTTTGSYPSTKSGAEQEKQHIYIQKELSKVVCSVAMMKRKVMNRTVGLESTVNDGCNINEEETAAQQQQQQQQQQAKKEASLLQMIQIQVWIRMMMWSLEGEAGWTYLEEVMACTEEEDGDDDMKSGKKQKRRKKKKDKRKQVAKDAKGMSSKREGQQTPRQALIDQLTALFELVPYVLPPSMDFSVCIKDILTFGYRQNVPEYGTEILEHFEIELVEPVALKRSGTDDTSRRSTRSEVSHSPVKSGSTNGGAGGAASPSRQIAERRAKRQQAYFASLIEEEKTSASTTSINADDESATITGSISTVTSTSRGSKRSRGPDIEKDDTKLLKTSVSLTAAVKPKSKENPFLKGSARGTYVGSHLSSKLSNISTLFREVTVPVKKPKMRRTAPTASLLATNKRKAASPREKKRKGDEAGPKAPFNITAKVSREQLHVNEKTRIRETPTKKPRVGRTSFHSGRADTYPPLSTPRRIIEETPAKSSRRVVISETPQPQPRFRRQQLDYLPDARHDQLGKRARNRQHTSSNNTNDGLSPMIQYGGLSPMPQKKNVVADAAKAAARKRK